MLKNGKYDSKEKSVVFIFFLFEKNHHFGGSKHSIIPALPGLDRKKSSSSAYCLIAVLLNLKFQLDMFNTTKKKDL
jgi:hypothetical protein